MKLMHGNAFEEIKALKRIDAVVTDPPYGMNLNTDFSGIDNGRGRTYKRIIGDDKSFNPTPFLIGTNQIFWGAQYFCHKLPERGGWLVFNKRGTGKSSAICFGDCELAWCSKGQSVRMFDWVWHGASRTKKAGGGLHPSQKPVQLMKWCIELLKLPDGATVLDPFMGSGTTGIACVETGYNFIGIEIEKEYFDVAKERIATAQRKWDSSFKIQSKSKKEIGFFSGKKDEEE